jgi:uncharacterized OsmC-like protein
MAHTSDYHVKLHFAGGYEFFAEFPDIAGAPKLLLDEAPPLGEAAGPNPAAVLAAAIGNCLSASLLFCLRKVRMEPTDLQADVTAHVGRNEGGRLRVTGVDVTLRPSMLELDPDRFERCNRLFEDFCTVTESVRRGIPVNVTVSTEVQTTLGGSKEAT